KVRMTCRQMWEYEVCVLRMPLPKLDRSVTFRPIGARAWRCVVLTKWGATAVRCRWMRPVMNMPKPGLGSIPIVDIRDGGPLRPATEGSGRARSLRDECFGWFPPPARPLLPLLDGLTRQWLSRSCSPYLAEISAIARTLGFPGVWLLNGSYQWACTSAGRDEDGVPWLARTLDWPFPGLGRHAEVAQMAGPAGDFWGLTWPGYVGGLHALS